MPDTPKPWVFTRSRNFQPEGTLRLGQILAEPKNPYSAVISRKGKLIPARIQVDRSFSDSKLQKSEELENRFKAWAKLFGQPFGASAEAKTTYQWVEDWNFQELHGEVMPFDYEFGKAALDDKNVKSWVESQFFARKYWTGLYMVTGIRWAKGAKLQSHISQTSDVQAEVGGNLAAAKIPAKVGAQVGRKKGKGSKESFENASDFVFQYCLHKIKYSGKFKAKAYKHGETEGDEDDEEPVAAPGPREIESLTFIGFGDPVEIVPQDLLDEPESPGPSEDSDSFHEAGVLTPPGPEEQPGDQSSAVQPAAQNDQQIEQGNHQTWSSWWLTKLRALWRGLTGIHIYNWLRGVIRRR